MRGVLDFKSEISRAKATQAQIVPNIKTKTTRNSNSTVDESLFPLVLDGIEIAA